MPTDPVWWAERATAAHRLSAGARLSQLVELARSRGCTVESRSVPGEAGRTFYDGQRWRIWIDERASYRRNRFTLAHEIGHLVIAQEELTERRPFSGKEEESWCDTFAAELLMPSRLLRAACPKSGPIDLAALDSIADQFQVTCAAAVVRLNKLELTSLTVLTFKQVRDRWALYSTLCLPRFVGDAVRSARTTTTVLSSLPQNSLIRQISLPLVIRGADTTITVSVRRAGVYITVAVPRSQLDDPRRVGGTRSGKHERDRVLPARRTSNQAAQTY